MQTDVDPGPVSVKVWPDLWTSLQARGHFPIRDMKGDKSIIPRAFSKVSRQ